MTHCLEADGILFEGDSRKILADIYVKIETGKIAGLWGRNGSGKTCLMNVIYGTLNPTNKSVRIDGKKLEYPFKRPELLTYLPQFNFLPKSLKIEKVFADFNVNLEEFLAFFPEFSSRLSSPLARLSGGQRRLIEVYVIIKSHAVISMLDEPFTLLMPIQVEKIKEILIREKAKKGFLMTDHLYKEIAGVADYIYMLNNGGTHLTKSFKIEKNGYIFPSDRSINRQS